jgi:NADP-dependent 3-hydroxy acid dehydrogenase YdfG
MKTVFFTGATGGLGSLCVKALSETGRWTVFAAGTNDTKLAELGKLPNVIPVKTDVTCQESVLSAYEFVSQYTDKLDAIVNFAGLTTFTSLVEGNCIELTEQLLAVNVTGTTRVNRIFFDLVYAGHGRIINCSSEAGWMKAQPFAGPYFLSKRALEIYNDSLRRELMYIGIPVIKIQPGSFDTSLPQTVFEKYDATLQSTKYYQKVLNRMKPLMVWELNQKKDPALLVKVVLKVLEAKHPRLNYKVGTGVLLSLLEILPDKLMDKMYQWIFNR